MSYKIISITPSQKDLIKDFLRNAGNSLRQFRYFNSRNIDVIKKHLVTFVVLYKRKAVGYAHLDKENDKVWLGIAIAETHKGKGLGRILMAQLFEEARKKNIKKIILSVDSDNLSAISLYEKYGFVLMKKENKTLYYKAIVGGHKENKGNRASSTVSQYPNISISSVAVSTVAFSKKSVKEIISIAKQNELAIEFTSGLPFRKDMEKIFLKAPIKKFLHNYFPAPEKPFVLNLASANDEIRSRSIAHCINGLRLASLSKSSFFSAHAGFCIDPNPSELGKQMNRHIKLNRNENWKLFIDSLKKIFFRTEKYKVDFLIENNVIARMNLYPDGANPLFCCDDKEVLQLIKEIKNPRLGILLDIGHLKVSAKTLSLPVKQTLANIKSFVRCIHHSDNDGIFDTNQPITEKYWFWKYISQFQNVEHILEVKNQTVEQIEQQISLIRKHI